MTEKKANEILKKAEDQLSRYEEQLECIRNEKFNPFIFANEIRFLESQINDCEEILRHSKEILKYLKED